MASQLVTMSFVAMASLCLGFVAGALWMQRLLQHESGETSPPPLDLDAVVQASSDYASERAQRDGVPEAAPWLAGIARTGLDTADATLRRGRRRWFRRSTWD